MVRESKLFRKQNMAKDKRPVICFIDDDPIEIKVFNKCFGEEFNIFAGNRPKPIVDRLKQEKKRPNLFVLDLYFPKGRDSTPEERQKMITLREKVKQAQKELSDYLASIGQNIDGGIKTAQGQREIPRSAHCLLYKKRNAR